MLSNSQLLKAVHHYGEDKRVLNMLTLNRFANYENVSRKSAALKIDLIICKISF